MKKEERRGKRPVCSPRGEAEGRTGVDVAVGGEAEDFLSGIGTLLLKVIDEYRKIEPVVTNFGDIISLEAWRDGEDKDGRVYAISVAAKDKADNSVSAATIVLCPHDKGSN